MLVHDLRRPRYLWPLLSCAYFWHLTHSERHDMAEASNYDYLFKVGVLWAFHLSSSFFLEFKVGCNVVPAKEHMPFPFKASGEVAWRVVCPNCRSSKEPKLTISYLYLRWFLLATLESANRISFLDSQETNSISTPSRQLGSNSLHDPSVLMRRL